jgi:hypothetical protein
MHQDAFAADYQEEEYRLIGLAIKFAGICGKEVRIIGTNRQSVDQSKNTEPARGTSGPEQFLGSFRMAENRELSHHPRAVKDSTRYPNPMERSLRKPSIILRHVLSVLT